jgi:hypothetical protein
MCMQPDNHAPSVTLGAQHLIAMCRKLRFDAQRLIVFTTDSIDRPTPNDDEATRPGGTPNITAGAEMTAMQRLDVHPLAKART